MQKLGNLVTYYSHIVHYIPLPISITIYHYYLHENHHRKYIVFSILAYHKKFHHISLALWLVDMYYYIIILTIMLCLLYLYNHIFLQHLLFSLHNMVLLLNNLLIVTMYYYISMSTRVYFRYIGSYHMFIHYINSFIQLSLWVFVHYNLNYILVHLL